MLNLYLDEIPEDKKESFVYDVKGLFLTHKMKCSETVKKAVQQIEQGQLLDSHRFQDRFGIVRQTFELSIGCMTICCVESCPNLIINMTECGLNARDFIIANCREGAVFMLDNGITFSYAYGEQANVILEGTYFKTIRELNKYIRDNV